MKSEQLRELINQEMAVVLYFSAENCKPCESIRSRLRPMLFNSFPGIKYIEMPPGGDPSLAASFEAFSLPLLLVFFDGKEFIRKGINMSFVELEKDLSRLYSMAFD